MEEIKYQRNKRVLSVMEGIFLILFSFALILDMGYVMRTFVAAFLFLFGNFYYVVVALLLFEGFYLIICNKLCLPRKKWQSIVLLFALLFALMLTSAITFSAFKITEFNDVIKDFFNLYNNFNGGFYTKSLINTFKIPFGGGLFGYFFAVPVTIMTKSNGITILAASILLGISLFIAFFGEIKRATKFLESYFLNENEDKPKRKKKTKEEKLAEKYKNSFVNESDVYLHADEVGSDEVVQVMRPTELKSMNFDSISPEEIQINNRNKVKPLTETGTIELVHLDLFNDNPHQEVPFTPDTVYPKDTKEEITSISEYEKKISEDNKNEETLIIEPLNEQKEEIIDSVDISNEKDVLPVQEEEKVVEPVIEKPVEKPVEKPTEAKPVIKEEVKPVVEVIQPKVEWVPPSTDLLKTYKTEEQEQQNIDAAREKQAIVNKAFEEFKVQANCVDFVIGPAITRLLIDYPSTGTIKAVQRLQSDISRLLNGVPVRFAETVQGTPYSAFEVPNPVCATVSFKEVFEALPSADKHPTAIPFGKDITGKVISADIAEFPHMLIAGTSGSGKSVFVNSLIVSLIARTSPVDLKLVLVDPKRVEMNRYKEEPHLLCPVINEAKETKVMLEKMVGFMNQRYKDFEEADCATNLKEYNAWAKENKKKTMPYIVIILDEYSDLVYSCKEVSGPLVSLCAKARACGIHVIVATQRPSTDIITGTIKANLNTRVCLTAASYTDSMTVIDEGGAEGLLGHGDMLVKSPLVSRVGLARLQGCFIQPSEIAYIVNYLKQHYKPEYEEEFLDLTEEEVEPPTNALFNSPLGESPDDAEEKYNWIKEWALMQDYVSMSKIQRECNVGFNRAGKMVSRLQADGILSMEPASSNRGFKVIGGESRFNDAPDIDSNELTNK